MMTVEERLALNKYALDEKTHIVVDQNICGTCTKRYCLTVCPAKVYLVDENDGAIIINHAGCLECGTCIAACLAGGLTWNMPASSMGIAYRYA